MSDKEIIEALLAGKRLAHCEWEAGQYYRLHGKGNLVNQDGCRRHFPPVPQNWRILPDYPQIPLSWLPDGWWGFCYDSVGWLFATQAEPVEVGGCWRFPGAYQIFSEHFIAAHGITMPKDWDWTTPIPREVLI